VSKNSNISSYDLDFILEGYKLKGVTSVDGSYSITETPINVLGYGYTVPTLSAPFTADFSVSREFVGADPILPYTGENFMNGAIRYGDKNFGFTTGYLQSYSIACGIGEIPSMSYGISVFGEMGGAITTNEQQTLHSFLLISDPDENDPDEYLIITSPDATDKLYIGYKAAQASIYETQEHPEVFVPEMGSIIIECDGSSIDRVTDFNYSINSPRDPVYVLNNSYPIQVNLNYPLEIDASFTISLDSYECRKMRDYLTSHTKSPINIKLYKPALSQSAPTEIIQEYTISNPELLSESTSIGFGGELEAQLSYKGYVNKR
jgi:hypothetical protein